MKQPQQSAQKQTKATRGRHCSLIPCMPGMGSILNLTRFGLYLAVLAWSAIVLGLACNFEKMLVASDLTRFVPLAIFIAVATMLVIIALLLAPIALRHNPVSTKFELMSLAFLGLFWLALGVYTATAEMGEVECFADDDETEPIEFSAFTTDIYHAQYRALEGFAIINVFLLLGFLFFMLFLAYLQQRKGNRTVWTTPMSLYPWFGGRRRTQRSPSKLPPPVTAKDHKSAPPMASKSAAPVSKPPAAKAPLAPPKAASKPTVYQSGSTPAPARAAAPTRTNTLPASASAPARPKATTAKSTPAVAKPSTSATTKAKNYSGQYTRPAAGIPQTQAAGQSNYRHYVPPIQKQPAAPTAGQKAAAAPAPSKRR